MKQLKLILTFVSLIILLSTCPLSAKAYDVKRGNVTAALGPYIFRTNFEDSDRSLNSPNFGGFILTALGDVSDYGSLEVVVIYMNKLYFRGQDNKIVAEKTQVMHISLGYRYWFGSYLSGSLGLFTSYPMGIPDIVRTEFSKNQTFNTSARELSETGADLALQLELWNSGPYAITAETRYSYSLTKMSNEHADQYGASVSIRYFVQGPGEASDKQTSTRP